MRIFSYVLSILICAALVTPVAIEDDTTIVQDGITYTVLEESGISEAEIFYQGIKVDGDTLMTSIEGGLVNITFHEWGENKHVTIYSSTPQTIRFKWLINGSKQYFKDDVGLHIDTYKASEGNTSISLVEKENSGGRVDITNSQEGRWTQRNIFFFVLNGYIIRVTNGIMLLAGAFVIGLIVLFRVVRR